MDTPHTPAQFAESVHLTTRSIYRLIRDGLIESEKIDGKYTIPMSKKNCDFAIERIRDHYSRPESAWVPDGITDYHEWHELTDEFVWLIKVCYSDKADVKRKHFRLDNILVNYLRLNKITLRGVKNTFGPDSAAPASLVSDDLKRGWYNEFAFVVPQKPSTLGHSFSDIELNKSASSNRLAFPSWRITEAYYAVYFYLRAVALIKQQGFRLEQHGATISAFKYGVSNALGRSLWRFPFDIRYEPGIRVYRKNLLPAKLDHTNYGYARHPRAPHRSPVEIFNRIYEAFREKGKAGAKATPYMLFDYLHDFRVWANYLDIDNLLNLWGGGYKAFLDQNLAFLLFFIGAISEICYMAIVGTSEYVQQLQRLYDLFAVNNPELQAGFVNTPLYQRYDLYRKIGFVTETLALREQPDNNRVLIS
jgi:hypothetical protein